MGGVEPWNTCTQPFVLVHQSRIFQGSCAAFVHGSSSEFVWVTLSVAVNWRAVEERSISAGSLRSRFGTGDEVQWARLFWEPDDNGSQYKTRVFESRLQAVTARGRTR